MTLRIVNLALYVVTFALIATGVALLTTNRADAWWLSEAHRFFGASLCILLLPKSIIIARALLRRITRGTWRDVHTAVSLVLTLILVASLFFALGWTLNWMPFWIQVILYVTPLGAHWYVGLALIPLFLWHAWVRGLPALRVVKTSRGILRSELTRRHALELVGLGALSLVGVGALNFAAGLTGWQRRFTGSRVVNSFRGNDFPVTHSGTAPRVDGNAWRLRLEGRTANSFELDYAELLQMSRDTRTATLDCTLGWASSQIWRGVSVARLLERAGVSEGHSVAIYAKNDELVLLSADQVSEALIATHVGEEPLSVEHGFPARLVVPARRGYQWIKWINRIVVG